eukprot:Lithocolla_globosa_v1_NODE_511_length_3867_cov_6.138248.p2 type:complete len:134 gc:universal NODE_511_length_3867_cov_6.138248:1843-1442(-)
MRQDHLYFPCLLGLIKPLGLTPAMFSEFITGGSSHNDYCALWEEFQVVQYDAQIPPGSPYFVAREQELVKITDCFNGQDSNVLCVLIGLGGCGKSQLAAHYAQQSVGGPKSYQLVRWLKSDTLPNLRSAYFAL